MRVTHQELRSIPLRAHAILHDVPLHDAWRFTLRGGGPDRTTSDVIDLFEEVVSAGVSPLTRGLFALRRALGRVFRWNGKVEPASGRSHGERLTQEDCALSLEEPGVHRRFWTVLYTFRREATGEIINRTVHAFLVFALLPNDDGYSLYLAIFVKPVNRFTPLYMKLIDPFRRYLIYPRLIRRVERAWQDRWDRAHRAMASCRPAH